MELLELSQVKTESEEKHSILDERVEPLAMNQVKMMQAGTGNYTISDETMEYVGILAKLELSKEEKKTAKKDMESMLDYIEKLNELDTSNIEPMSHIFSVKNVFREDVVEDGDGGEETLANAPERRDRAFVVPKTVE